jgi:DNA/RNA-binding domain of Phe-tRNA-synthetase-like protein
MRIDVSDIAAYFPDFRVAVVVGVELAIPAERPPALAAEIARREAAARERWAGTELADIPGIAAWRRAYRQYGIKRTSYRSAVERLVKNALAERALPAINGFVDAYNAVSLTHVLPAGADDLDLVKGDLAFRYARPGDSFLDMGARDEAGRPLPDPPKAGEVVYADAEKVLCRRWNWRQDARSVVTPTTRRAVVTLQANGHGDPAVAAADLVAVLQATCGGRYAVSLAGADAPAVELTIPA